MSMLSVEGPRGEETRERGKEGGGGEKKDGGGRGGEGRGRRKNCFEPQPF